MTSLQGLKFELVKNIVDLEEQYQQICKALQIDKSEVLSLTHTPRNIGQINIQIMWYIPGQQRTTYAFKHFQDKGDLQQVLYDSVNFLNGHVAPHNLVSISVFEDDHPCPNKHYHAVIYYKGDGVTPLNKPKDIQGDIYTLHQFESD